MSCHKFKKYELGKIDEEEFKDHLKSCATCQAEMKQDAWLMSLAKSLKQPVKAPYLWGRIENTLKEEEKVWEGTPVKGYRWRLFPAFGAAVLFLMIISVGLYFLLGQKTGEPGLLAEKALIKVEKKENEYLQAIGELEERVLPKMASLNLELMLLYRDRLETIDDQINRCKEALGENPANAHIRRYLLAALQDKKETLSEILELANES